MAQWIGVVVLAAGALLAGVFFGGKPPPPPTVAFAPPTENSELTVHVTGAVARPGLVTVGAGSRVADAVAAAGGLTPDAAVEGLNLAAPLRDGLQVVVPTEAKPSSAAGGLVSLSAASVAELTALPGVGPVLAQRIVDYRARNGPFAEFEDLLGVPGIGEAKLSALRDSAVP